MAAAIALVVTSTLQVPFARPCKDLVAASMFLAVGTWSYYQAMRYWGVDLTMAVLTITPVVNIILQLKRREKVPGLAAVALLGLIGGACIALQPWHGHVNARGLGWSLISVAASGYGFDRISSTKGDVFVRVFWLGLMYTFLGAVMCFMGEGAPFVGMSLDNHQAFLLLQFGIASVVIFVCNLYTFDHLHKVTASVFSAAQVVAAILGALVYAGEAPSRAMWIGTAIAFGFATWLAVVTSRIESPPVS